MTIRAFFFHIINFSGSQRSADVPWKFFNQTFFKKSRLHIRIWTTHARCSNPAKENKIFRCSGVTTQVCGLCQKDPRGKVTVVKESHFTCDWVARVLVLFNFSLSKQFIELFISLAFAHLSSLSLASYNDWQTDWLKLCRIVIKVW